MTHEVPAERTTVASGGGPAVCFSDRYEKGMVFIVELCISREVIHEEGLDLVVRGLAGNQPMAREDSLGICIDDEDGHITSVQEDRVCRFLTDTRDLEEDFADLRGFPPKHPAKAPPVSPVEYGQKVLESARFDGKGARRTDEVCQAPPGQG